MSGQKVPKTAILLATDKLSGAQNRAIAIFEALERDGYPIELWIEPAMRPLLREAYPHLEPLAVDYRWGSLVDRALRFWERRPALWRGMHRAGLMKMRGAPTVERQARARGIELLHIFLDLRVTYLKHTATLFELTSPDIVDAVATWPAEKIASHTAYHAVSPSVFRRFAKALPQSRAIEAPGPFTRIEAATVDYAAKQNTVIFAHRFIPRKNALLFARVALRFAEQRPGWKVRMLGFGPLEAEIRRIVAPRGEQIEVDLIPDLKGALAESRVFASLIEPDNYPSQSVMEAMAAGNALLLSDTGDSKKMFLDGNGIATDLGEERVLADLLALTEDGEALDEMGRRSQVLALERFDQARYLAGLKRTYAAVSDLAR